MATIIILLGSMLGFISGLTAYFGFDVPFWVAVGVWAAAGPIVALLVILTAALAPQRNGFGPVLAKVA